MVIAIIHSLFSKLEVAQLLERPYFQQSSSLKRHIIMICPMIFSLDRRSFLIDDKIRLSTPSRTRLCSACKGGGRRPWPAPHMPKVSVKDPMVLQYEPVHVSSHQKLQRDLSSRSHLIHSGSHYRIHQRQM